MKVLFDSSIFVAAFLNSHPGHTDSLPWLQKVKGKELDGVISAHSLVEVYSVLTRLPLSPKISSPLALHLIKENILNDFEIITYTKKDYIKLLENLSNSNITGGASYDGLILIAAEKLKIDKILTLNIDDFIRVSPQFVRIVQEP